MTSPSSKTPRNITFDIARSIAIIYIVCLWHVRDYIGGQFSTFFGSGIFCYTTEVMLGAFMFISGLFLSKYSFSTAADVKTFYIKRIKRFYPLYALAAVSLFLIGFNPGAGRLASTLAGVSTFIQPQPATLWFMSMLMMFYMLTPLLLFRYFRTAGKRCLERLIGLAIVTALFVVAYLTFGGVDSRLFYCFPCYVAGIFVGELELMPYLLRWYSALTVTLLLLLYIYFPVSSSILSWLNIDIFCGIILLFCVSKWFSGFKGVAGVAVYTSYISMCMYLFHRHVFALTKYILLPFGEVTRLWLFYLVAIPLVFIVAYTIQKAYDGISDMTRRRVVAQ